MMPANPALNDKGEVAELAEPQDWTALKTGDEVYVVEPGGYTYSGRIDAKTERSDVVWIRCNGLGTRHLLDHRDGIQVEAEPRVHTKNAYKP